MSQRNWEVALVILYFCLKSAYFTHLFTLPVIYPFIPHNCILDPFLFLIPFIFLYPVLSSLIIKRKTKAAKLLPQNDYKTLQYHTKY